MWDSLWKVAHEESIGILIGAAFALLTTCAAAWWRRRREMREIIHGQQFQQLEFAYAFVTTGHDGRRRLVVRMIGCLPLKVFVAKDAIRSHLLGLTRESAEDELNSVISMEGKLGSFVLRELHGHLRTLLEEKGDLREWWVMAPILETYRPLQYVAPTVLLIRKKDLEIFRFVRVVRRPAGSSRFGRGKDPDTDGSAPQVRPAGTTSRASTNPGKVDSVPRGDVDARLVSIDRDRRADGRRSCGRYVEAVPTSTLGAIRADTALPRPESPGSQNISSGLRSGVGSARFRNWPITIIVRGKNRFGQFRNLADPTHWPRKESMMARQRCSHENSDRRMPARSLFIQPRTDAL